MRSSLLSLALLALAPAVVAQQSLQLGEPVERDLAADDAHEYALDLGAGQFVLGVADQHTVDVVVTVAGPDGERVGRFDGLVRGPEPFRFTTESEGVYTLTVTPYSSDEGRYALRLVRAEPVATTPAGTVDQQLAGYDERTPGAAVAVVQNGEVVFASGYGSADLDHGVPITPETVFNVASVSKPFTAFAVALLADQGRLELDDDVSAHVPEFQVGQSVTVRQLLHHTSGVRDLYGLLGLAGKREGDLVSQEMVLDAVLRQRGLSFEPGTRYEYSNSNYNLLAEIVERVTGEPFRSWMRDHVFEPLQMRHTFVGDDHREVIPGRARSYEPAEGGYREEVFLDSDYGSGGVYSTVGDLACWLRNLGTSEVGGEAVAQRVRERGVLAGGDTLGYALGVYVDTYRGVDRVQHSGSVAGYRSFVAYYPELDAGVVVLGNDSRLNPVRVGNDVVEAFFPDEFTPPPTAAPVAETAYDPESFDPSTFDAFVGRYEQEGSPGYTLRIGRDGERYTMQLAGREEWEITPVGPSSFRHSGGLVITFDVSPDGSVETVSAPRLGDQPFFWIPTEPEPLVLADFVGQYHSDELDVSYEIRVEDGGLVAVRPRGLPPVPLTHSAGGRFMGDYRSPIWGVVFERGADGSVTGFTANSVRTAGVRFERVD